MGRKTKVRAEILPDEQRSWERAAELVAQGKLVAFPTDTVYGIGCDPRNPSAIKRIYAAKGRSTQKAIPVLLAGVEHLGQVALTVPPDAQSLGARFWPGALTLVVPRRPELPEVLSGGPSVAVRVPDHDSLRWMIHLCGGALAATSANRSGEPDALDADSAYGYLSEFVSVIVDGGATRTGLASTVVDCTVSPPRVLREGTIPASALSEALGTKVECADV